MRNFKSQEELEKLLKSIESGRGIKFILDLAAEILENPIVLIDTSYKLLAHTQCEVSDDPVWNELTTRGKFSHGMVNFFNSENFINAVATTDVITILTSKHLKYDRICGKLYDRDGVLIGSIAVVACYRPFTQEDYARAETICEYLSVELQNSEFYDKLARVFQENLVSDIIDGRHSGKPFTYEEIQEIYSGTKSNLYVGVVDISRYEDTYTHLAYFRDLFYELQSEFKYYIYLNNIVIIMSTDNPILTAEKDLKPLDKFFAKHNLYAGISSSFQDIANLHKHYKDALNALNYGLMSKCSKTTFMYDDYRTDCFLNSIKDTIDISELCSPVIPLIREFDKENGTKYFDVMYEFLMCSRDIAATAKSMGVSYVEIAAEIEKMRELFGIDWTSGDVIFNLFASMKIFMYFIEH